MSVKNNNQKGFTLIELVIVLAIGALIIAGVLIAVSGAQKSRRDTTRKNDQDRIAANLEQFASNHGGDYPTTGALPASVIGSITNPSGGSYIYGTGTPNADQYKYVKGTSCDGTSGTRYYSLTFGLESGDQVCVDNK
jgi:prepilin-type N-terminal cleavage/methylation domain-containing protein